MDLNSVENDGDAVPYDRGLDGLPFPGGFGHEFIGRLEVVNRTVASERGLAAIIIAQDLNFVPAPQIETAVGMIGGRSGQ
jgi:hypothetical protein